LNAVHCQLAQSNQQLRLLNAVHCQLAQSNQQLRLLNAVHYQLAQGNHQLCLQQNLILRLQQQIRHCLWQHDADLTRISKLVEKLSESECRKHMLPRSLWKPRAGL
ncbi:unnamed protein product, partial [Symbiodinium sp. CCMP2592]